MSAGRTVHGGFERGRARLHRTTGARTAWGVAILRVTVGAVFLAHGIQKAVVWGMVGGAPFFREAGIPLAEVAAPLVTTVEVLGGAALLVGYGTRPAAALLALVAVTALVMVHLPYGFFLPNGVEFVLVLAAANITLLLTGAGACALDGRGPGLGDGFEALVKTSR